MTKIDELLTTSEKKDKFIAIGECGLNYNKFNKASKEEQLIVFVSHFDLAEKHKLPMYLHSCNTGNDFYNIVKENRHKFSTGVVNNFIGTIEEMKKLLDLGLYIGINAMSMMTEESCEMVKAVPMERLMVGSNFRFSDIRARKLAGWQHIKTKFLLKA